MKLRKRLGRLLLAAGVAFLLVAGLSVALAAAPRGGSGRAVAAVRLAPGAGQPNVRSHPEGAAPRNSAAQNGEAASDGGAEAQAADVPAQAARTGSERRPDTPPAPPSTGAAADVRRAWQRAGELGVYHFASDLIEKRYPAPSLVAVGSGPQENVMRLEGEADLPAHKLTMRMWQGGVSAANLADSAEMMVEQGKAYTRRPGGVWRPVEDFSGNFAPGMDLMSYLAGIKNVTRLGTEARALPGGGQLQYTRYSFEMDGPTLATYMRDRLEQVLREQGKLPLGMTLEAAREYRELTGQGEVWLDEQGLPLRLTMHLVYPPAENGSHSEADLQSDFSGFPQPVVVAAPTSPSEVAAWAGATLGLTGRHAEDWQAAGRAALALVLCAGLVALIVLGRRSYRVYAAVAVAVILAMAVVPLLQDMRVAASAQEIAAQAAKAAERERDQQAADELAAQDKAWDPHRDPLAALSSQPAPAPQQPPAAPARPAAPAVTTSTSGQSLCNDQNTADDDGDGLNKYEECLHGTDFNNPYTDGDGLTDGQEILYLGTNPLQADTDGDMITDTLEVQGFVYPANGQHWYLDPRSPDTNGDGLSDGLECPPLRRGDIRPTSIAAECDTDGDDIPNLFESDNDNDGLPDKVDLSPNQVVDQNGVHGNGSNLTPFSQDQPFDLLVQGLAPGWPAFVDLQLRPQNAKHLTYALNVLDWPADDTDGQIQHAKNTTFVTSDNPDIRQPDDQAGAYGDMKLVPMMEIEMSGSSLPLKLAMPAITATLGSGTAVSATVRFGQDAKVTATTHITFTFGNAGTYSANIFGDECPGTGTALWSGSSIANGQERQRAGTTDDGWLTGLADGHHALVISNGTTSSCAEIPNIVNGPYANRMIDQSVLAPYGIGLQESSQDANASVLAYVPLSTVTDETGGGRTAFSARMPYWPGNDNNAWAEAQEIRMVWAVQAMTDSCVTDGFPDSLEEYQKDHPDATQKDYDEAQQAWCLEEAHRTQDQLQIVQTYPDNFYVAGLAVREDHGLDLAVAYPDATKAYDEDPLWQLSWGLGQNFITGRDCENDATIKNDSDPNTCHNDGLRDLTIYRTDSTGKATGNSTIYDRFGTNDPSWTGSAALWGIAQGALEVDRYRYGTQDYLGQVAMSVTPAILEKFNKNVKPSLLFAREERYRSAGLEAGTQTGGVLVMNVGANYQEQTLAAMNWAPFHYNTDPGPDGNPIGWESYPISEYYDTLEVTLKSAFSTLFPQNDADTVAGQAAVARSYYLSLYNGMAGVVQPCPPGEEGDTCPANEEGESPEGLILSAEKAGDVMVEITGELIHLMLEKIVPQQAVGEAVGIELKEISSELDDWENISDSVEDTAAPVYRSLGRALADFAFSPWKTFFTNGRGLAALGVGMAAVAAGALITIALSFALGSSVHGTQILQRVLLSVGVILNVMVAVKAVEQYIKSATKLLESAAEGAGGAAEGGVTKGGLLRLAIEIVILWAAFVLSFKLGGVAVASMAWDNMLAGTIATTIVCVLMFFILAALGPIGELIGAIIGAIDALIRLICNAFLSKEQQESRAGQWLCGGISGILNNIIKRFIYSGTLLVVMDPGSYDRLTLGNFEGNDLTYPERGLTYPNSVKYSIEVTNTAGLAKPPLSLVAESGWDYFTMDNLRRSNFDYKWQAEEDDFSGDLALGGIKAPGWQPGDRSDRLVYHDTVASEEAWALPTPGLNKPIGDLYLSEGYAVPESECWGLLMFSKCSLKTERSTSHYSFGDRVKYDVLPGSLDDFYSLSATSGGYALSWDPLFPALHDADGDGLPYSADPNDSAWDTDGDGLSDQYEVETGTDPSSKDTDKDGLTDYQEGQLGTNPRLSDSDGDGLYDCQEVFHYVVQPDQLANPPVCGAAKTWYGGWDFVYGTAGAGKQLITHLGSNPNDPDADADGYIDSQEKIYGFNPSTPSQTSILTLDTHLTEGQAPSDGYVKPGDTLGYQSTVKNELNSREAQGLLWTQGANVLNNGGVAPQSFVLMPQEQQVMAGNLSVASNAASGVYSLTQAAGALITDWRELSGNTSLWLQFEDAPGATTYADTSGSMPANDGQCAGPAGSCTIVEGGGRYGSAVALNGQGYVTSNAQTSATAYATSLWLKLPASLSGQIFSYGLFRTDASTGPLVWVTSGGTSSGTPHEQLCVAMPHAAQYYYNTWNTQCVGDSTLQLADAEWHQIVNSCSGNQFQLYLDGRPLLNSYAANCGDAGAARFGAPYSNFNLPSLNSSGFQGQMDDVRLYPQALSAQDVQDLYNQPVFRMNFEQHTSWTDASSFHTPVTCSGTTCPSHDSLGAVGWGAALNTTGSLNVGATTPNAQLDLSGGEFTIAAWLYPNCATTANMLILGSPTSASQYPSLSLKMGFVGFALNGNYAQSNVGLAYNAWNHLAVVYDSAGGGGPSATARLYLNGEYQSTLQFGTATNPHPVPAATKQFYIGKPPLGYGFCGKIDEVQIFNHTLTDDGVRDLLLESAVGLRLRLDEPPGATAFADASGMQRAAACSRSTCPTAGVAGRVNRAAGFNRAPGHSSDRLVLANTEVNGFTDRLTVAAWIRPDTLSGVQMIAGTVLTRTNDGWGFGTNGSELTFTTYGVRTSVSSGANLQANRWYHVGVVFDSLGSKSLQFYLNGQPLGAAVTGVASGIPDTADQLMVGGVVQANQTAVSQQWHGLLDDLTVFNAPLTSAGMSQLYAMAPVMHLAFDDDHGAASFANDANPGTPGACAGAGCPQTGESVKGQMELAAQFDGQQDFVTVPDSADLHLDKFTVGAWVKPSVMQTYSFDQYHHLVLKSDAVNSAGARTLDLYLTDDLKAHITWGCKPTLYLADTASPLIRDHWNHVMATYDGQKLSIYLNGALSGSVPASGTCPNDRPVYLGNDGDLPQPMYAFGGSLDEVTLYRRVLGAPEIHDLYLYQNGWVEDRQSGNLTVDTDNPTVAVALPSPAYQANYPAQVLVQASDKTSGVTQTQLCVGTGDCSAAPSAPYCVDPASAWCPTFTPTGQGVYKLSARATDRVGHTATSAAKQVYVDDTAPALSLTGPANGSWYPATANAGKPRTWVVHFTGSVSDPGIASGVAGSGVPADGVRVTLYRGDGGLVGTGAQAATVTNGTWALDYLFSDADPSGCYNAVVEAVDQLAQTSGLPDAQVARHTTTVQQSITVDADAPYANIDWTNLPGAQLGPQATALLGNASSRPIPVVLTFTGGTNSADTDLVLSCQHGNEGSWWEPYSSVGSKLVPGQTYTWGEEGKPIIHRGSSCQVHLTTSAASDDLAGKVTICGQEVLTWSGGFNNPGQTLSFIADSDACGSGNGCPAGPPMAAAGVGKVDVSFQPVTPGSPFFNEQPPAGEALHLTMDSGFDGSENPTFPDVSPSRLTGTCGGTTCPVPGETGHEGRAALFDGVDDRVTLPNFGTFGQTTASAWIKRTGTGPGRESILSYKEMGSCGFVLSVNERPQLQLPRFWIKIQPASGNAGWMYAEGTTAVPLNTWVNLAGTYDGTTIRLYENGQLVASTVSPGSMVQCTTSSATSAVGSQSTGATAFFPGLIDEVRVFDHALIDAEVKSLLYTGSGPLLVLPFEKDWVADGSVLEDISGWQRNAVLHTGSGDSGGKASTGQVGSYALQLDGVDDYALVPDDDTIDFDTNHDFAIAAWIKPAPAQVWTSTVDNNVIEKWSGSGGYPYSIRYRNQTAGANAGKISAGRWDGQHGPWLTSATRIDDSRFHHVGFVKSGPTLSLYVDGALQGQTTDTTTGTITNSSPLGIGRRGNTPQGYFTGSVDDVRIYPRALSTPEIQSLYLSGWQASTVAQSGSNVDFTNWQTPVPKWLEGSYRVEARGWDTDGHTSAPRSLDQTWSGEADTLGPRVTLVRSPSGAGYRYTTTAEDYNLTGAGLVTPCPSGTLTTTTNFQSPWYVAAYPASPRLYRLVADCTLASQAASEQATACDTFGNCATTNATAVSSAAEVPAAVQAARAEAEAAAEATTALAAEPAAGGGAALMRPAISFVPTVLTTTHLYPPAVVDVTGLVSRTNVIKDITVSVGGASGPAAIAAPASRNAATATWRFSWPLGQSPLPDGVWYTAVATGTRRAGGAPIVQAAQLLVDVVPPGAVPLALRSGGKPVAPGDTLRNASPELVLSWAAASDGSGVAGYVARWTAQSSLTTTQTAHAIGTGGALEDRYAAGEAQKIAVDLASRDVYDNIRWQEVGPVYADSPRTPDYIALDDNPYEGWQDSGCSLLGADRRVERRLGGELQQLYATWDHRALRLAWTGATWSGEGDLFVYLDTGPGGTNDLFNPGGPVAGGAVQLSNDGLQADYLVWVQDAHTATLLHWDGSAWKEAADLTAEQYRFDPGRQGGQTDLYLPFDLLGGYNPASSLGLLALASEEPVAGQSLQLWAALPQLNPLNSPRVNRLLTFLPAGAQLNLRQAYRWPALSDGACPNGSDGTQPGANYGDIDAQPMIESDPPGVGLSGLGRGLFWVTEEMLANAGGLIASMLPFVKPLQAPVDVGQKIHYTVRYRNGGSEIQKGVRLALTGNGVTLAEGEVALGDVPPGAEVSASFDGEINGNGPLDGQVATVRGLVYDAAHPSGDALEWLWMGHRVDHQAPSTVGITGLGPAVGPKLAALSGFASDESGVRSVDVEIAGPNGMATITCPVARPAEGQWQCTWNVNGGGLPDGAQFTLRVRATDLLGHTGDWSSPRTVPLDTRPPVLQVTTPLTQTVIRGGANLFGSAQDGSGISAVRVCADGRCRQAKLLGRGAGSTGWTASAAHGPYDNVSKTLTIYAKDGVGNETQPMQMTVKLDNVAPTLTVNQVRAQEALGERQAVLQGMVKDGEPDPRVFVRTQAPNGTQSWQNAARDGDQWSYDLAGEMPGRYTLWVRAVDEAGNERTMGPYAVDVTCTDAALATTLTVERLGASSVYTLTAVITNNGPATLPAGVPVTLYAGETPLGGPQLLPALAKGQTSSAGAQWTRPAPGGTPESYEFSAIVNEPPAVVLCATPPMGKAWLGAAVDLVLAKTVQPSVALPGNVVTYTLAFTNTGSGLAAGVVISDVLPVEILNPTFVASGASLSRDEAEVPFAWQVDDLAPGAGGTITITGMLDPALATQGPITNTVTATAHGEATPADNTVQAVLQVDLPPAIAVWPGLAAAQYSDSSPQVAITATDVAGEALVLSTEWRGPGTDTALGLPDGLALSAAECADAAGQRACRWTLAGPLGVPAGAYTITARVTDAYAVARASQVTLTVTAEEAALTLAAANPLTVTVPLSQAASGPFTLSVEAREASPDQGLSVAPGDLGKATLSLRLVPASGEPAGNKPKVREPGGSKADLPALPVSCDATPVTGEGYEARAVLVCHFDAVPIGRYAVQAVASGGYYAGAAEGALDVAVAQMQPRLWLPLLRR